MILKIKSALSIKTLKSCFVVLFGTFYLSACAITTPYQRPEAAKQLEFVETGNWIPIHPMDHLDRGPWWDAYQDPVLNSLEKSITISNQTLAAELAAYDAAKAAYISAKSALFPSLSASGAYQKAGGEGLQTGNTNPSYGTTKKTSYSAGLSGAWALDLWGKARSAAAAAKANAEMTAYDLAGLKLSLQINLAQTYFALKTMEEEVRVMQEKVTNDNQIYQTAENQYQSGLISQSDVITAKNNLETDRISLTDFKRTYASLIHALAVLVGKTPEDFIKDSRFASLGLTPFAPIIPTPPLNLASTLLQRRPDIASAERALASSYEEWKFAKAAYFPNLNLSFSDTSLSSKLGDLFKSSTTTWAYGADIGETLIDFGARDANVKQAKSLMRQRLALYRQTVLAAFQNVEDDIVAAKALESERKSQSDNVSRLITSERISENQYHAGLLSAATYLAAQNITLEAKLTDLSLTQSNLEASLNLIEALGGGFIAPSDPGEVTRGSGRSAGSTAIGPG